MVAAAETSRRGRRDSSWKLKEPQLNPQKPFGMLSWWKSISGFWAVLVTKCINTGTCGSG
jgi:hypothetical protein